MEFINDTTKIRKAIFARIKNITVAMAFSIVTVFVIGFSAKFVYVGIIILNLAAWIWLYGIFRKEYLSFKIEINDSYIFEKYKNVKFELNECCQVSKDVNDTIYITNGKNEISVSKYLKDKDNFEKILTSQYTIKPKNEKYFMH